MPSSVGVINYTVVWCGCGVAFGPGCSGGAKKRRDPYPYPHPYCVPSRSSALSRPFSRRQAQQSILQLSCAASMETAYSWPPTPPEAARRSHQQLSAAAHAPLDGVKVRSLVLQQLPPGAEDKKQRMRQLEDLKHIRRLDVHRPSTPVSLTDSTIPQSLTTALSSPSAGPPLSSTFQGARYTAAGCTARLASGKTSESQPNHKSQAPQQVGGPYTNIPLFGVINPRIFWLELHQTRLLGAPSVPLSGPPSAL